MKKWLVAVLAGAMLVATLTGCSKPETVEEYYGNPAMSAVLDAACEQAIEDSDGVFSDVYVETEGNTLTYVYVMSEAMELNASQEAYFETSGEAILDDLGMTMTADLGIEGPVTIGLCYQNPDGSALYELFKDYE